MMFIFVYSIDFFVFLHLCYVIAKNNENAIFLLYLKSFRECFKSHHLIYQITAPFPIPIPHARRKLSDRSRTLIFFSKRPLTVSPKVACSYPSLNKKSP